jgi:hypothetical protein
LLVEAYSSCSTPIYSIQNLQILFTKDQLKTYQSALYDITENLKKPLNSERHGYCCGIFRK